MLRESTRLNEKAEWRDQAVESARRVVEEDVGLADLSLLVDRAMGAIPDKPPRRGRPRAVKPVPIPDLQSELVKATIKPGKIALTINFDEDHPLGPTLHSVSDIFARPDFNPASLLAASESEPGTPVFWQQGTDRGDGFDGVVSGVVGDQ